MQGQQRPVPPPMYQPPPYRPPAPLPKKKGNKRRKAFLILAVVLLGLIAAHQIFFTIRTVEIAGISHRTNEEVLALAGFNLGDSVFFLNKDRISAGINSDRYLIFMDMKVALPDKVIISVYEREPVVKIHHMGMQYLVDMEGMVLEESHNILPMEDMIYVTGFTAQSYYEGTIINVKDEQLKAYKRIMTELTLQQCIDRISECSLADTNNIYITTRDGFFIRAGSWDNMQAKIGSMRAVLEELRKMQITGGIIDVSAPLSPIYSPDETS